MTWSDVDKSLGQRAATAREYLQLSVEKAAQHLAISPEELKSIEAGQAKLESDCLAKMSVIYGRPIAWFFEEEPQIISRATDLWLKQLLLQQRDEKDE